MITGMKTISNAEFRIFTETTKVEKIERVQDSVSLLGTLLVKK